MTSLSKHARPLAIALGLAIAFGACDEQLEGGLACPALCPQEETLVGDTTIFAVDLDTVIAGFPSMGNELALFIASFGDTLETRGVVRFDSLPQTFRHTNSAEDSTIFALDTTAHVKFSVVNGDTTGAPTTVEVYDVDMNGADNDDPTAVKDVFTPDRLIGSRTFEALSVRDSIQIPIDRSRLLARIQTEIPGNRLRLGVRVNTVGGGRGHISLRTGNAGAPPELRYRQEGDSTIPTLRVFPMSKSPAENFVNEALVDYLVVVQAPPEPTGDVFRVGGTFGRRVYLRFVIPSFILDSTSIVRASLLLTQRPNPFSPQATDTVGIQQMVVTAAPTVTDLSRVLLLVAPPGALFNTFRSTDSLHVVAADSGVRSFEMIDVVRSWRGTNTEKTPRALVLRSTGEGASLRQADFFSLEGPIDVRPKLRLTYVRRRVPGLP